MVYINEIRMAKHTVTHLHFNKQKPFQNSKNSSNEPK